LEEEQRAEQNLTPQNPPSTVLENFEKAIRGPIIKHTLFDEEETASGEQIFEGYIDTSELIKNIDVVCEEINIHHLAEFEQVMINEIDVNDFVIVEHKVVESLVNKIKEKAEEFIISEDSQASEPVKKETFVEDQMLMFDLPVHAASGKMKQQQPVEDEFETITSRIEEIEVKDHVEVVPVTEISEGGVKRYSLDDYQEIENYLTAAKPSKIEAAAEEEIVFEKRTIDVPKEPVTDRKEAADPLNTPISKLLSDRTEERKMKMKEFNYKFRNSASKIDDIEKQPAYKRMGIELDEISDKETNFSRTSVNTDDNDIDLRKNNSFLHDNVD
jgi:cell division protein FtsZ